MRTKLPDTALAEPLTPQQIGGAERLYMRMPIWQASNAALRVVAKEMPNFDLGSAYTKVLVLNALYSTRILATLRMAANIERKLRGRDRAGVGVKDVDHLATVRDPRTKSGLRRHVSFASKFAHFFIAPERFPMVDQHAKAVVSRHLGIPASALTNYVEFAGAHQRLKDLAGLSCSNAELDHYIWLAGQIQKARRTNWKEVNSELRKLVGRRDPAIKRDIDTMLGNRSAPS